MPDKKEKLYLFEAIELRNEYDRHIELLLGLTDVKKERFSLSDEDENKEPSNEFDQKEIEKKLKKLQTKRLKLNQEIQITNFQVKINFKGEEISLTEALEVRKNLLSDIEAISRRVQNSSFKSIIHKEERDIIKEPRHSFKKTYDEFQNIIKSLRTIVNHIHIANHTSVVKFKEE